MKLKMRNKTINKKSNQIGGLLYSKLIKGTIYKLTEINHSSFNKMIILLIFDTTRFSNKRTAISRQVSTLRQVCFLTILFLGGIEK